MHKQTIIYVVRHGQAKLNVKHTIGGTLEPNLLTPKGEEQARKLGEKFKNINIDKIYSSDSLRAQKTAEIIASMKNLPVKTSSLLRERNWGILQGKTFNEAKKEYPKAFLKESKIEGEEALEFRYVDDMESLGEAIARFNHFLKEITDKYYDKTVLIVSHFDIIVGYLFYLGVDSYQRLMNADMVGYYTLIARDQKFKTGEVFGLKYRGVL